MKKFILLIFLPFIAHTSELSEILRLEIPPVSRFIENGERTQNKSTHAQQGAALIPNISFNNTVNYLNIGGDFDTYNYSQKFDNKLGITFTINPGALYLLHNQKNANITTLRAEIFTLYGDIMLIIAESVRLIDDLRFKVEYRKALTDYKQQLAQDEIIFKQKSIILKNYQEAVSLLLQLHAKCGMNINFENAEYNYQYETIEKILKK